jgi:uncharacterized protein YcfL
MKKIFFALVILSGLIACKSNDKKAETTPLTQEEKAKAANDTANFTTIQWLDSTSTNLGKLKKDNSVEITYRFKNTGTKNLIIESVTAQCGCTIPEKPEQAFAPGEEGIIKAKFNGSGHGIITKQVYVTANTTPAKDHTLTFSGEIIE